MLEEMIFNQKFLEVFSEDEFMTLYKNSPLIKIQHIHVDD